MLAPLSEGGTKSTEGSGPEVAKGSTAVLSLGSC
jgi:hypothetical protein